MAKLTRQHFEAVACNRDKVLLAIEHASAKGSASISQTEIATVTGIGAATVARILIELEQRQMIRRSRPSAKGSHGSVPHTIQIMVPPRS